MVHKITHKKPSLTAEEKRRQDKLNKELNAIKQKVINRQRLDVRRISAKIPRMRKELSAFAQASADLKKEIEFRKGQQAKSAAAVSSTRRSSAPVKKGKWKRKPGSWTFKRTTTRKRR